MSIHETPWRRDVPVALRPQCTALCAGREVTGEGPMINSWWGLRIRVGITWLIPIFFLLASCSDISTNISFHQSKDIWSFRAASCLAKHYTPKKSHNFIQILPPWSRLAILAAREDHCISPTQSPSKCSGFTNPMTGGLHRRPFSDQVAKALAVAPTAATTHNGQIKGVAKLPATLTSALKELLEKWGQSQNQIPSGKLTKLWKNTIYVWV